jgi:hypothetical protein
MTESEVIKGIGGQVLAAAVHAKLYYGRSATSFNARATTATWRTLAVILNFARLPRSILSPQYLGVRRAWLANLFHSLYLGELTHGDRAKMRLRQDIEDCGEFRGQEGALPWLQYHPRSSRGRR